MNMLANRALTTGGNNRGIETSSERMVTSNNSHHEYHLNEVLSLLPNLQHGMDVNPKFTSGPTGVEYTNNLAAFDLLGVELVHGWLLDPQDLETVSVVESRTYNELIETVIHGNEAREGVQKLEAQLSDQERLLEDSIVPADGEEAKAGDNGEALEGKGNSDRSSVNQEQGSVDASAEECPPTEPENIDATGIEEGESGQSNVNQEQCSADVSTEESPPTNPDQGNDQTDVAIFEQPKKPLTDDEIIIASQKEIADIRGKISELSLQITRSEVANAFLSSSGHQLTYHGLEQLHRHMGDDALCVFFRNNHFATLTKHDGVLYLLVTDLGYSNTPEIVWEKLDNIDGDTEYANEFFVKPTPRTELKPAAGSTIAPELLLAQRSQAESDYQLALAMSKGTATSNRMDDEEGKLIEAAKELSLKTYHGDDDAAVTVGDNGNTSTTSYSHIDSDLEVAMAYQRAQQQSEHDSEQLARQLQELEYARQRPAANPRRHARPAPAAKPASASSSCIIS